MHMYMHEYAYTYTCRKLHSNALPVLMSSQVYVELFFEFFRLCWLMLVLLAAIFAHLVVLGLHFLAKLLQDGAKMGQHSRT